MSLLKPSQAFVDNPSDANDAAQAGPLAGRIAALFVPALDPEDWWEAGLNIQYRKTRFDTPGYPNFSMFHFKNTSAFSGGNVSAGAHVFGPGITEGSLTFLFLGGADPSNVDDESVWEGWVKTTKFGNNDDRKRAIEFMEAKGAGTFNPAFKTWPDGP